ncbi:hypothetical protein [Novosphingobium terrae]|uniref:hypothetical protein n=1 Tax=Novosphingobium terrae TaxID=2726189 RepID=UPI00197F8746|nr:hypothetical protein [Novosphingobium terrae]
MTNLSNNDTSKPNTDVDMVAKKQNAPNANITEQDDAKREDDTEAEAMEEAQKEGAEQRKEGGYQ